MPTDRIRERVREKYQGKKIIILGFGREGRSTYAFLRKHLPEQTFHIMDRDPEQAAASLPPGEGHAVVVPAGDYLVFPEDADYIFKTPGIPGKLLDSHGAKGERTSQMDEFLRLLGEKVVGVTGTKGKSTTATLLHKTLQAYGFRTELAGNIGRPVLDLVEEAGSVDWFVAEMSSHQLEETRHSPAMAILLNVFEEHLDHYRSYGHYVGAKLNIARFQKEQDCLVYGCDSRTLKEHLEPLQPSLAGRMLAFGRRENNSLDADGVFLEKDGSIRLRLGGGERELFGEAPPSPLPGIHSLLNSLAVLAILQAMGLEDPEPFRKTLERFEGLEHRLELVGEYGGIRFYNDSISTIPQATLCAVEAIPGVETVLLGGMDRGVDYGVLEAFILERADLKWICLPETGHAIADRLLKLHPQAGDRIRKVGDLGEGVALAYGWTTAGKACLLSPAAASYNTFKDFTERGNFFKAKVRELGSKEPDSSGKEGSD
ncbi:UDP-N-acetylmuramoyl-L-alanine--D-glutamate ligase [Anaerotalea alkaliphila]|uniref:UDP-N-acetylmuramoylalanine--D-glutamate ligase n=1 Tax=Anaerotalea alkaliphila TaxID=2662126 RepID=A0A7X5KPJ0_9FIRM|nr:UDP-N-acetylmuramoyl-L-alanine--D-glutamate ligase [Anaerotalea alkaliphila]NDL68192.1 UDP-N-acetylmuramoyl-L-alanine--D-glutamate ligase [Anaerotalea alkaliphila]